MGNTQITQRQTKAIHAWADMHPDEPRCAGSANAADLSMYACMLQVNYCLNMTGLPGMCLECLLDPEQGGQALQRAWDSLAGICDMLWPLVPLLAFSVSVFEHAC